LDTDTSIYIYIYIYIKDQNWESKYLNNLFHLKEKLKQDVDLIGFGET